MFRYFLSCFLTLVLVVNSFAQIDIEKKNRIENFGEGFCAWVSIESLARHHGIKTLYNLAKNREKESDFKTWDGTKWIEEPYVLVEYDNGRKVKEKRNFGTDWGVYRKLNSLGVKYQMQWSGDYDHKMIDYAMKNKLGCCFAVKQGAFRPNSSAHALVLLDFNEKTIMCFDPNDINWNYIYPREWFDRYWMGWVLVLEKEKQ